MGVSSALEHYVDIMFKSDGPKRFRRSIVFYFMAGYLLFFTKMVSLQAEQCSITQRTLARALAESQNRPLVNFRYCHFHNYSLFTYFGSSNYSTSMAFSKERCPDDKDLQFAILISQGWGKPCSHACRKIPPLAWVSPNIELPCCRRVVSVEPLSTLATTLDLKNKPVAGKQL